MGKVTFYYVMHSGRGVFDNPKFVKAFQKADVLDLEAGHRLPPDKKAWIRAIAAGDRERYAKLMDYYGRLYKSTKDPRIPFNMDIVTLLLNSKKKVEFEEKKRGERLRLRARAYRLAPVFSKARGLPADMGRENYRDLFVDADARSIADSKRIARKMRIYPSHNRLVIRGEAHDITTDLLRKELKGRKVDIESIYHLPRESVNRYSLKRLGKGLKRLVSRQK